MTRRLAVLAMTAALVASPALAQSARVVGGQSVAWSAYPSVIAVDYIGGPSCTGSRVSADWVLTAAHCVDGRPAYALSARAVDGFAGVDLVVMHPDYQSGSHVNDVALVRLASPLPGPIVALAQVEPAAGDVVDVVGFGRTAATGAMSATLQRGRQHVIGRRACSAALNGLPVDQGRICAADEAASCNGDSGGPLFDTAGRQVGIVSLGRTGCPTGSPTAYASIAAYRGWIEMMVWGVEARAGWYWQPSAGGTGIAIAFDGAAAFLGQLGFGVDGTPSWSVARLSRQPDGAWSGAQTWCPRGPTSCGETAAQVSLRPTPAGLVLVDAAGTRTLAGFRP